MLKNRRATLLAFILTIILLLGLIFHQFVLENIITPIALVVWLLLRLFILSLDQSIYWAAGVLLIFIYVIYRFFQSQSSEQLVDLTDPNPALNSVEYWRTSILLSAQQSGGKDSLKQGMANLLVSFYSPHRPDAASFQVHDALAQGEIPLPGQVYAFLFHQEPPQNRPPFFKDPAGALRQWFQAARLAIQRWLRRRTGRQVADYYQAIGLTLDFMEESLEMKNDDEPGNDHPR